MVKAQKGNNLFFGLSEKNIELIKKGSPIKFNLKELNPELDFEVWILYGKDESALINVFYDGIGPNTILK